VFRDERRIIEQHEEPQRNHPWGGEGGELKRHDLHGGIKKDQTGSKLQEEAEGRGRMKIHTSWGGFLSRGLWHGIRQTWN
jgi:hypothetical protein